MRRLLLALTVLSLIVPATAQMRGGGMRGGGFRGAGIAARGGGMRTAGRMAAGQVTAGTAVANGRIISLGVRPFPRSKFGRFGHGRFRGNRFFFGNNCFGRFGFNNGFCNGFGFNSGFAFGGWGLPWYIGDYDADYDRVPYAPDTREYQQSDNRDQQVQEMLYELRDQQRELDYLINSMQRGQEPEAAPPQQQPATPPARGNQRPQSRPYSANAAPTAPQHAQPATTLVFKDGHRMDVHNYVMAKGTLTVLDAGMRQHIQLSQIDIPATKKANEDKGVDFKAPTVTVSLMCNPADPDFACRAHTAGAAETGAANALRP